MLDTGGEQVFGLELEDFAVAVERPHADAVRARYFLVDAGDGQAAFLEGLFAVAREDLRVDKDLQPVALIGQVDHDHALRLVDLDGGQADAGRVIHGLGHIVDQATNGVVDLLDR